MIKSIRLQNFFSFRDETIELNDDINIFLGINGSGKSTFFKAIKLLKEGVAGNGLRTLLINNWGGFDDIFNSSIISDEKKIVLEYTFDSKKLNTSGYKFPKDPIYKITILQTSGINYSISERLSWEGKPKDWVLIEFQNGFGVVNEKVESKKQSLIRYNSEDAQELYLAKINDSDRYPVQKILKDCIAEIVVYDFFDTRPESRIRKPVANSALNYLSSDGSNLTQILNLLQREKRSVYEKILKELNNVNNQFKEISFRQIGSNLEFYLVEWSLERAVPLSHISDGTLRYLCLLVIILNPKRGKLVCIDEPELGLHPDMINQFYELIIETANHCQFSIITHSTQLLDYTDLEHLIIVEKDPNNSSTLRKINKADFEGQFAEFHPGQMWLKGFLGGVRW
jgi:predicted ATPase